MAGIWEASGIQRTHLILCWLLALRPLHTMRQLNISHCSINRECGFRESENSKRNLTGCGVRVLTTTKQCIRVRWFSQTWITFLLHLNFWNGNMLLLACLWRLTSNQIGRRPFMEHNTICKKWNIIWISNCLWVDFEGCREILCEQPAWSDVCRITRGTCSNRKCRVHP